MNKKGFTLVEILVAIVLIGLLFGIGIAGTNRITKKINKKSYKVKEELILNAAELYGQNHKSELNTGEICEIPDDGTYYCKKISIEKLIELEYLENENNKDEFINPINNINIIESCVSIYIKNNRVYTYFPEINTTGDIEASCE